MKCPWVKTAIGIRIWDWCLMHRLLANGFRRSWICFRMMKSSFRSFNAMKIWKIHGTIFKRFWRIILKYFHQNSIQEICTSTSFAKYAPGVFTLAQKTWLWFQCLTAWTTAVPSQGMKWFAYLCTLRPIQSTGITAKKSSFTTMTGYFNQPQVSLKL